MEPKSAAENISDSSHIGAEFLISDARTALTLLDLAATTDSPTDRSRRIAEAYKAYTSILSFMGRIDPGAEQMNILRSEMETLALRLREAGIQIN
jgi:hypothetical protein